MTYTGSGTNSTFQATKSMLLQRIPSALQIEEKLPYLTMKFQPLDIKNRGGNFTVQHNGPTQTTPQVCLGFLHST